MIKKRRAFCAIFCLLFLVAGTMVSALQPVEEEFPSLTITLEDREVARFSLEELSSFPLEKVEDLKGISFKILLKDISIPADEPLTFTFIAADQYTLAVTEEEFYAGYFDPQRWQAYIPRLEHWAFVRDVVSIGISKTVSDSPYRFVVLGDNRPARKDLPQPGVFRMIINRINNLHPAFVVHTGDLIFGRSLRRNETEDQYREYLEAVDRLECPIYTAPGNHDIDGAGGEALFTQHMGRMYFSFNYDEDHFIILNTEEPRAFGTIRGEQLQWLKNGLEQKKDARHHFVFLHRPLFPTERRFIQRLSFLQERQQVVHQLFVSYGVDMVVAGHEHLYNRSEHDGIVYLISGGAGAPLYAAPENGGFYHFVLITVKGDEIHEEAVRIDVPAPTHNPGIHETETKQR